MNTAQMKFAPLDNVRGNRIRELESELGFSVVALVEESQQAYLSDEKMLRLQAMERELGVTLVAYESASPLRLANPTRDQLAQLEELEKKTGLVLVAYELNSRSSSYPLVSERDARPANLSDEQYQRLQEVECEVNLTLMAYEVQT
jgi:hypothetical protein